MTASRTTQCPTRIEFPFVVFGDEWGLHQTSTQHLVRRLAATNPILYVNGVGARRPRWSLYDFRRALDKAQQWALPNRSRIRNDLPRGCVYSPMCIPYHDLRFIRRWNKHTMVRGVRRKLQEYAFDGPILLVSSPIGAEVVGELGERLVVYYVTDEYAELPGACRDYVQELEQTLLAEADLILVTSTSLRPHKRGKKGPTVLLPHGVDFDHFHSATHPRGPMPEELKGLPRPILGFFGLLAPWIDADLLRLLARAFPQASVVLIGPTWSDFPAPDGAPNLHWLGPRSYADLPRYAAHFDVGLIPFRQDRLTAHVNPLKLLEYLALGLPVVSTPLPDLERVAHLVYQAAHPDDFVEQVRLAMADCAPEWRHLRVSLAAGESWEARLATLQQHVQDALRRRTTA